MRTHVERTLIDHDFETEFQQTFGPAMEAERSGFRRFLDSIGFGQHDRIEVIPEANDKSHEEILHSAGIYSLKCAGFPSNIVRFIHEHPELRIEGITGDGNGVYGHNDKIFIITRPARRDEQEQHALRIKAGNWPESLVEFKKQLPHYQICAVTADGNGVYGSNDYFVAVVQQLSAREMDV